MPVTCAVASCKNTGRHKSEITFHRFPRRTKVEAQLRRRNTWIKFVKEGRLDKFNPDVSFICSAHFADECWIRRVHNSLRPVRKLLPSAVPTLCRKPETISTTSAIQGTRASRSSRNAAVFGSHAFGDEDMEVEPSVPPPVPELSSEEKIQQLEREVETLKQNNADLNRRMQLWKKVQNERNVASIRQKQRSEQVLNEALRESRATLSRTIEEYENGFTDKCIRVMKGKFGKIFTENQLSAMMRGKKRVNWTTEDIAHAFTLRYLGVRGYIYLRRNLGIPLPGISTLQRWLSMIDMRSGFLDVSFLMLKIASSKMTSYARNVVISFDEVKVKEQYEYDTKEDEILGIHKQMQVIMVRSLTSAWKQPIYVGFDQKVTKDILFTAIKRIHDSNLNVVAMVSDMGGSNVGLWTSLDVSVDQTFFINPVTQKKIFVFADAPHLLKLIRNWLLAYDFHSPDGSIISVKVIRTLIKAAAANAKEVSSCFKLGTRHIDVKKTEKQNVQLAAELLSHTTATALKHYKDDIFCTNIEKQVAVSTAKFIELTDAWFNIMDARVPTDGPKKAYGLALDKQNATLTEYVSLVQNLSFSNSKKDVDSLQLFQKGVIITSKSMMGLLTELNTSNGVTYILGARLNQDCLENLYCQLRTNGGLCDHPTPLAALYRLRMLIGGKSMGTVQHHANTLSSDSEEFLMASVLKQCKIQFDIQKSMPSEDDEDIQDEAAEASNISLETIASDTTEVLHASEEVQNEVKEFECDGVRYLAGWVAKKLKDQFPHLGDYTYKHTPSEHGYAYELPTWTRQLSFGGLIEPSEEWYNQALNIDRKFKKYSGETFLSQKKCIETMTNKLVAKFRGIDPAVIRVYARQRTFIRMKYLNAKYEEKKQERKRAQKLKRMTS